MASDLYTIEDFTQLLKSAEGDKAVLEANIVHLKESKQRLEESERPLSEDYFRQGVIIETLNALLDYEEEKTPERSAFANISRKDVNALWFQNKLNNKRDFNKQQKQNDKRRYELRAFEHNYEEQKIQRHLLYLRNQPHMTKNQRDTWLAKQQTRRKYTQADVPHNLRGQERSRWLEHKNKKQKLYESAPSGYENYVFRRRELGRMYEVSKNYKYNYIR